ncbi:unnamed protein product [Rotaria sp. Silwood2]|nr:unnamed protein product [Rotaria sp. Silwood2]CAF3028568.1 unnamed protein product [Rotaria sp. Silwood2]CAF4184156.1 unnamed protein product [Rotaria sp. Silwood2]CAF4321085.1 unnamed protein product [Rotaria sp. Silwood2]
MPSESVSLKQAQLKINLMIRPMLESMRNILRNLILWNKEPHDMSIKLHASTITNPTGLCLKCPRQHHQVAEFWVNMDNSHVSINNKCRTCQCDPSDHSPIDYILEYKCSNKSLSRSEAELITLFDDLFKASVAFAHFLLVSSVNSETDPFLSGWTRMIKEEEEDICDEKIPCKVNHKLMEDLQKWKDKYENKRKEIS